MIIKLNTFDVYADQDLTAPVLLGSVDSNSGEHALRDAEKVFPVGGPRQADKDITVHDGKRDVTRTVSRLFVRRTR